MGLLTRFYRRNAFDLSSAGDQLGTEEFAYWQQLQNERRRGEWLMGRLALKRLFFDFCTKHLYEKHDELKFLGGLFSDKEATSDLFERLQVISVDAKGKSTRATLWLDHVELKDLLSVSVSHTEEGVFVALQPRTRGMIGVDLAPIESFTDAFARFWIPEISELSESSRQTEFARYWVAKESAYKCLNEGDSFRPRRLHVRNLPTEESSSGLQNWLKQIDQQSEIQSWDESRWLVVESGDDNSKHCVVSTGMKEKLMFGIALRTEPYNIPSRI